MNLRNIMKNSDGIDELRSIVLMMQHKINIQSQKIEWLLNENHKCRDYKYKKARELVKEEYALCNKRKQENENRIRQRAARKQERERFMEGYVTPPPFKRPREEPREPLAREPPVSSPMEMGPLGPVKKRLIYKPEINN